MDLSKKYLITGGSGFLGESLIDKLIENGVGDIRVVARNEGKLINLKEKFPDIEIITGDIASKFICEKACRGVSGIFHLAAFKHVGLAEKNVRECIYSNVMGTMNLLDQTKDMDFIVGISTDKAVKVNGTYGATKFLMERLFAEYETMYDCKYRLVRYGNVLYSTGSVLCKWKDRIQKGEKVIVTDLDATRFFWTVDEAVELIFGSLDAPDSKPLLASMKSIRIADLLDAMIEKYSGGKNIELDIVGLQEGENLHEIITADGKDSSMVEHYSHDEIIDFI